MTIEEIYFSNNLSKRTLNLCIDNELFDISAVVEHYNQFKTFQNLRRCGSHSNSELIELSIKYYDLQLKLKIEELSKTQIEIINNFIEISYYNISVRGQNTLLSIFGEKLNVQHIYETIIGNERFNFLKVRNSGKKTAVELNTFIDKILDFTYNLPKHNEEEYFVNLKNKITLEKYFPAANNQIDILSTKSIFQIISFLINENLIFEKKQNIIFQNCFKIYSDQKQKSNLQIADEIGLTRERVRQIFKEILPKLTKKFAFVKDIQSDLFENHIILNENIVIVDDELSHSINNMNFTNFSREFNSFIIQLHLGNKFSFVGKIEDILTNKNSNSNGRHIWSNYYLISNTLYEKFNFTKFFDDIRKRLKSRIDETYSFNIQGYISNYMKPYDSLLIPVISNVVEKIISTEFGLVFDLEDNIIFKRNTFKHSYNYAIEALELLQTPSKIELIHKLIQENNPEIEQSIDTLRSQMLRAPEIIFFGRSSTYGLKKWEKEKEGIKGGTIKDIIFEYLQSKANPVHVKELLSEVHNYREKTNSRNIITNLKLDPFHQFVIFNQNFVGLTAKQYNSKLTHLPKFLGKTITTYIRKRKVIKRQILEDYFAKKLNVSNESINFIVESLIDGQFIKIQNENFLTV